MKPGNEFLGYRSRKPRDLSGTVKGLKGFDKLLGFRKRRSKKRGCCLLVFLPIIILVGVVGTII